MKDVTTLTEAKTVLTQKEAANFLRISTVTLWRMRQSGELPCKRIRGRVVYSRKALEEFINKQ